MLDFTPIRPTPLAPEHPAPGVETFRPDVPDFALEHIDDLIEDFDQALR